MSPDLLAGLTPEQREAVLHQHGPLLILAGAGSGKTRVITRRIACLIGRGVAPEQILAITFTNKAAGEMRERVEDLLRAGGRAPDSLPAVSTFHAFAARLLRRYGDRLGWRRDYTILDEGEQQALLREAAVSCRVDLKRHSPWELGQAIGRAKERLDDEAWARAARTDLEREAARVLPAYRALQRERQALDFEDLVGEAVRLLEQRPEVRAELLDQLRYVLIDEYQDTNHAQYRLAGLLAGERRNLAVCGDPDQSIYGWRGADMRNILRFEEDYPGAKVVLLERNYRSTATILEASNHLIGHNTERKDKQLRPTGEAGTPVEVRRCLDERLEAEWVAQQIEQAIAGGVAPGEVAVIYRAGQQAEAFEEALLRRGVPCATAGSLGFFDRREVKDALAFVRLLANPADDLAALRALKVAGKGLGKRTVDKLQDYQRQFGVSIVEACRRGHEVQGLMPRARAAVAGFAGLIGELSAAAHGSLEQAVTGAIARSGLEEQLRAQEGGEERCASLRLLAETAREADRRANRQGQRGGPERVRDFLDRLALLDAQDKKDDERHKVTLTTIHASKGLEFDLVFVVALEEGLFPHERALQEGALEEERRLAYVAFTRARKRLVLSYAGLRRARSASGERRRPSRFLHELPPALLVDPIRGGPVDLPPFEEEDRPAPAPAAGAAALAQPGRARSALVGKGGKGGKGGAVAVGAGAAPAAGAPMWARGLVRGGAAQR